MYPAELSIINEGEIKTLQNKQKLKAIATTCLALQMIFKHILHTAKKEEKKVVIIMKEYEAEYLLTHIK